MSPLAARRAVLAIILLATALRLVLAGATGLGMDESYMVTNARDLALGYVDHPPLHVWLAWLAQTLAQSDAPLVVRAPFVLLFAGSTWLMYRLTERLFGPAAAVWAVVTFNILPVFSLADGTWVLPDGPLVFFLLASANVLAAILFGEMPPQRPWLSWIAAGALGGLALLSKYSAVLFFLAVFLFLLSVPSGRRWLRTSGPWLGVLAALVVFSPALVWNIRHEFLGFAFQGSRLLRGPASPSEILQAFGGQFVYLTPWLLVPLAISLAAAFQRGREDLPGWFLSLVGGLPIAVFAAAALLTAGLPHWPMPGWLFAIPLFGRDASALAARRPAFARGYISAATLVFLLFLAAFWLQTSRGALIPPDLVAANPSSDPTTDLIDWHELRAALAEQGFLNDDIALAAPHWTYAGKTSYALGKDVSVLCLCADQHQFAYRDDWRNRIGQDAVIVVPRHASAATHAAAAAFFNAVEPLPPVAITRGGQPALTLDLSLGRRLKAPEDVD